MNRDTWAATLLSVIETLAALAASVAVCLLLGALALFLLAPPRWTVEIPLRPTEHDAEPPAEVARKVAALDLPEGVEVVTAQLGTRLLLTRLPEREFPVGEVSAVLTASGYAPAADWNYSTELDMSLLLRKVSAPYLTLQAIVFIAVGATLIRLRVGHDRARPRTRVALAVPLGVAAGLGAFFGSLLLAALLALIGLPVTEQQWVRDLLQDRRQVELLSPWIVLIVPISEEVFFRGYMFRRIARHAGPVAAMAISSVAFAILHFNASGFLVYVAIGWIFAWVYHRTGRLAAPIAGHVIHNSIVLLSAVLSGPHAT